MSVHDQLSDDLSLYALGALEGEEREALERHLEECSECRQELGQLRGDLALLALSASGPKPPSRSRERLLGAIAQERRQRLPLQRKVVWLTALRWAAAAAAAVAISLLWLENANLRQTNARLEAGYQGERRQLMEAKELIASLNSAEALHFTLVAAKSAPQPQGKAIYLPKSGTLVFLASNMPPLPPQKIYELWLIPAGGAPIAAGLFRPDPHGSAAVIKPPLPVGVEAQTFAITIEPESGSPAPTSQPIMLGNRS
jgi:anti-sigma-K factor RskA